MQGSGQDELQAQKAALRATALLNRRDAAAGVPDAAARLQANFLSAIPVDPVMAVSAFWPMGDEIDVRPLLTTLHDMGHVCCLPATGRRGTALQFRRWTPETVMVEAVFGTREPPASAEIVQPDLLIVPLLAFDACGRRLGYGAGYYDRTLAELRARKPVLAVGVGYAAQEVPLVPHHAYDEPLDWIVTESGAMRARRGEG